MGLERDKLDEKAFWKGKMIEKLLLTITVVDPQLLDHKKKPIINTRAFVKIYN